MGNAERQMCPVIAGLGYDIIATEVHAITDPRVKRRTAQSIPGNESIILLVKIVNPANLATRRVDENGCVRIVVKSEGRDPEQIMDAIHTCQGPVNSFIKGKTCPILQVVFPEIRKE